MKSYELRQWLRNYEATVRYGQYITVPWVAFNADSGKIQLVLGTHVMAESIECYDVVTFLKHRESWVNWWRKQVDTVKAT